jgi:choline monooxygenase
MSVASVVTAEDLAAARADLAQPAHLAKGLPGAFYGDAFYGVEQRTLFPKSWCAVSVAAALAEPGDVLPVDLAGWPILLVRNREGDLRAFHNICRHRAMRLVGAACSNARLLRCPWHSWSYDLNGALLAMPEVGGAGVHAADGFDAAELGLKPIPVGQFLDYIFVNLDGAAPPFEQHIAPLAQLLADLDLSDLRHGGRIDDAYRGNWKLSTEGGIEDYHLVFGHPQLNAHLARNTRACAADGVYAGGWVDLGPGDGDTPDADAQNADDAIAPLPVLRHLDGRPCTSMLVLNVFPTGSVLITPDHIMVGLILPDGPARTRVELHYYFQGDAATSVEHAPARDAALDMWRHVLPQDYPFVEGTQATVMARDAAGVRTRFSPYWEAPVLEFQKMVLKAVSL